MNEIANTEPTKMLKNMTFYEIFKKEKSSLSDLRLLGTAF
jgi:hypothetical protein